MIKILALLIAFLGTVSCSDDSSDESGKDDVKNTIKYGSESYSLTNGLEEVFKLDDNHSSSQINITNGEFYSTQVVISGNLNLIWRARNASVWLYVDMYAPGFEGLSSGTYAFRPKNTDEDDPALIDIHFFTEGKFAIDLNDDGNIESDDNEYIEITGGTIKVEVKGGEYLLELNLTLENNENVSGTFGADFDQV